MTVSTAPKLPKWPFFLADSLLLALAGAIAHLSHNIYDFWWMFYLVGAVALAAWMGILPFLVQHRADVKFAESNALVTAVEQLNNLRTFTNQISFATAQWQVIQEQAANTVTSARQIADTMSTEAKAFAEFMQKANDSERTHLRLEVEKLRRGEGEWLQVLVLMLDHVYALYMAGRRSGQENITQQLAAFQNACRDVARKMGVVPFEPQPDEPFNAQTHQLLDVDTPVASGTRISETLAPGYTYQGQLIRNALVSLKLEEPRASDVDQLSLSGTVQ